MPTEKLANNFYSHAEMDFDTGCMLWNRSVDSSGYGQITVNGNKTTAHRHAWVLEHGSIPEKMCVCHTCDNPSCINVDHLFLGTHKDNCNDMDKKGRRYKIGHGRRLDPDHVREIREKLEKNASIASLVREYGYSRQHIRRIRNKISWAHIP